jgi:ribonuclease HI
MATKKL